MDNSFVVKCAINNRKQLRDY